MRANTHTICFLFGHEWSKDPIEEWSEDKWAPDHLCSTCGETGARGEYFGDLHEGFIPTKLEALKIWACGFIGHKWWSAQLGDSGDYSSGCDRCGVDGDSDEPEYNAWERFKEWWDYYEWPWQKQN